MTLEETVLAIRLHKLAVALGVFIVSAPAFSHGHHSHGKPLTEVEQKAANGIFDDANVQNRTLSDWDGVWQSVYPLLQSGKLDPVFQKKADADKTKTFEKSSLFKFRFPEEISIHLKKEIFEYISPWSTLNSFADCFINFLQGFILF